VRLKIAREGRSSFEDAVYGLQERDYSEIEDLVLLRSDGHPLYNLSVVCDDIEMRITDVIRGQDHLTNTHKQILIYQALGARVPRFAHLPLILAPNKAKLSKRKHGEVVSLTTYRDRGFIPAAFRNFLALLGWSPEGEEKEIMSLEELTEKFTLEGVHRSPAVFNFSDADPRQWTDQKALWMNAEYIRTLPIEELLPMVRVEFEATGLWRAEYDASAREWFAKTIELIRQRFYTLKDFSGQGRAYFSDEIEFDDAAVAKNLKKEPRLKELLPALGERIERIEHFDVATAEETLRAFAGESDVKAGLLINASRTALTGQAVGPSMFDVFEAVGQTRSAQRLRDAARLV
jgi:glutamyl-tRNA synthetase